LGGDGFPASEPDPRTGGEGAAGKTVAEVRYPRLADLLGDDAVIATLSAERAIELESVLHYRELTRPTRTQRRILDDLFGKLKEAKDFRDQPVGMAFRLLVEKTLLFLALRHNVSRLMATPLSEYLFEGDDGKPETKEKALHQDFYGSLKMSDLARHVETEVWEIGGGRVDVLLRFDEFRFVVEIKRELGDPSPERLQQYLGQSVLYQSTDVKLGLLLVLDLTDKPRGPPSLEKSIWLARSRPKPADDWRYVVVAVVPGNRRRPSETITGEAEPM
jgi:hypothetical protein